MSLIPTQDELLRTLPNLDLAYAVSMLGDIYGFNSPIFLPYSTQRDYEEKGFTLSTEEKPYSQSGFNIQLVEDEEADRMSQFGTPVFGSFWLKGGQYYNYDRRSGKLINKFYSDFEFPVATIVDFERVKDITVTPTAGGTGSVKELFGFNDWRITIRGVCLNDNSRNSDKTAKEQQLRLIDWDNAAASLEIHKGKIFLDKGISRLSINRLNFSAVQGKPNVIPFEIEAMSDEDILILDV